jgi:two-component system sensor histidine kinase QseC
MISRELAPLREMSERLGTRSPQDSSPLELTGIPPEVRPFVHALNGLFGRVAEMREREQAFVADAAHELRTPLAGLRVQAEVVELSDDDPTARRHALTQMRVSIDRCNRLVEQLLTLSRLEALPLFPFVPLDWPALLDETLKEFRPQAADKGIALECVIRTLPARSMGAPPLMATLLRNLLDNAVKYTTDNGSIGITLDSHALTIENSGPGIADEYLARLGERFFRPPGQEVPGSGLGLSIAKQLAGRHGFTLRLQNRAGGVHGGASGFVASLVFG